MANQTNPNKDEPLKEPLIPISSETNQTTPPATIPTASTKVVMTIPILNRPLIRMMYGRQDSDYQVVEHTVQISNQNTIPGLLYNHLNTLKRQPLPLTRGEFTQMWMTLILKRVQDVYEKEKLERHTDYVRIDRGILLPGPLADLLHSLGQFTSKNGQVHQIMPPAKAAAPPAWWKVSSEIVSSWNKTCLQLKDVYTFKEFPSPSVYECSPLMLLKRLDRNGKVHVKSFEDSAQMTDALQVITHDDLFTAHAYITFDHCHLCFGFPVEVATMRKDYIRSYDISN